MMGIPIQFIVGPLMMIGGLLLILTAPTNTYYRVFYAKVLTEDGKKEYRGSAIVCTNYDAPVTQELLDKQVDGVLMHNLTGIYRMKFREGKRYIDYLHKKKDEKN